MWSLSTAPHLLMVHFCAPMWSCRITPPSSPPLSSVASLSPPRDDDVDDDVDDEDDEHESDVDASNPVFRVQFDPKRRKVSTLSPFLRVFEPLTDRCVSGLLRWLLTTYVFSVSSLSLSTDSVSVCLSVSLDKIR